MANIPKDKLLHNLYGTLLYILFSFLGEGFAIMSVVFIAIAKEIYDEYIYGGFDFYDIIATVLIPLTLFLKYLLY